MRPEFIDTPERTLVGIVGCASDVAQLDISSMWRRFDAYTDRIDHRVGERAFEIHVQEPGEPPLHVCLVGFEVNAIGPMASELFAKVVPAGRFAVFTWRLADGGFDEAFRSAYAWLKGAGIETAHHFDLQCYDARFKGPDDPESVLEIHVPVASA